MSRVRNSMATKLGQSFQAFRSEKQKRATSVVSHLLDHKGAAIQRHSFRLKSVAGTVAAIHRRTHYANEYCLLPMVVS